VLGAQRFGPVRVGDRVRVNIDENAPRAMGDHFLNV
jgi:hypothetical protein